MAESYRFTWQGGTGEIVEKKSRFIATVAPVKSEEEAQSFIEHIRKQYWDARHSCTAFTIGSRHQLTRCSDDGEPAGTAGRPMLDVLLGEGIHNAAVVVTRYFGGTLLGTGGLVRAYSKAVQERLRYSVVIDKEEGFLLKIGTDYTGIGKIQYLLGKEGIHTAGSEYTENVELQVLVPQGKLEGLKEAVTEATSGKARFFDEKLVSFAFLEGEPLIFGAEDR